MSAAVCAGKRATDWGRARRTGRLYTQYQHTAPISEPEGSIVVCSSILCSEYDSTGWPGGNISIQTRKLVPCLAARETASKSPNANGK